jgi:hypothetical protein
MSSLNLNELQKYQKSRENRKYDYFEEVLKKCHHKIKTSAANFEIQCFFQVPSFILGLPSYSQKLCCEYVMNKLIQDGLKVLFINPNILFITWDMQYVEPKKEIMYNNNNLLTKEIPKKIEYKPTSSMVPTKNFIYDPKVMELLKNKTDKF